MPTPLFNSVTGSQAAQKAVEARKQNAKNTKWLAKLGFKQAEAEKIFELLQTAVATPVGTFLAGWLLVDLLDRIGFFNKNPTNTAQQKNVSGFLNGFKQGVVGSFQLSNIFQVLGLGFLGTGSGNTAPAPGSLDADLLKTAIFSIAMVQAVGGGSGINSLLAPLLTAAK